MNAEKMLFIEKARYMKYYDLKSTGSAHKPLNLQLSLFSDY